jgi:translation initiation factor 1A
MPKNAGGKKFKKNKHHLQSVRELVLPEKDQYYALVNKLLGNCRVTVSYIDPTKGVTEILSKMRKTLKRKKQWVKVGNYVLISLRDFEEDKSDVIHVYNDQEMNDLKKYGYIGADLIPTDKNSQYEDTEFVDILGEEDVVKKTKVRGLGRNNLVKENYGIISSDEEESDEEQEVKE